MPQNVLFVPSVVNRSSGGVTCKVRSDQTDNRYAVLELVLGPGQGAPLHVHQREDEIMFIVEGELEVTHGDETHHALPGGIIVLPKGLPHAFRNSGTTPNRVLITAVPGGLDRYFEEINALAASGTATQAEFDEVNQRYEIDFSPQP
jgi:mannose-6-phosphate isomerase-like protein (cupin superfamily)